MSYFIAHTITISKDWKTFKTKGGCSNVIPREDYWLENMQIENLFYYLSSGDIQLTQGNDKNAKITMIMQKYKKIFGGSFDELTDYYHMHKFLKPKEGLEEAYNESVKNESMEYYKKQNNIFRGFLDNYEYWHNKVKNLNYDFINELKNELSKKEKEEYILTNGYSYIGKKTRGGYYTYNSISSAKKYTKTRAMKIESAMSHHGYKAQLFTF